MGWDSFGVVRFDLGPLLQGQLRIAINLQLLRTGLLLVLQVWDGKQATGNHGLGIFLCGRI